MLGYLALAAVPFLLPRSSTVQTGPTGSVVAPLPQTTKRPSSAQAARADQGDQANQPWYSGAVSSSAGAISAAALAGVAAAIGGFFTSSWDSDSELDLKDEGTFYSGEESIDLDTYNFDESIDLDTYDFSEYEE